MKRILIAASLLIGTQPLLSQTQREDRELEEAVVTGTREETDARNVPMTVSVVPREKLTQDFRLSVLPTLTEEVPGLFITGRGMMGYGISTGAAGTMRIRGVGGMAQMLVLIDGMPQYAALMGHPIPDAYQTMIAERVEVLRGPASLLYGSNAMGGVVNIVTRKQVADGTKSQLQIGGGSYGTLQAELSNQTKAGRFNSTAGVSYQRSDGHRDNINFEQAAGFLKMGYQLNEHWQADVTGNLSWVRSSNPGETNNPLIDNDSRILRGMGSATLRNHYARTGGALSFFYSGGHHHINDGYSPGGTPRAQHYIHNDVQTGIAAFQTLNLLPSNHLTLGVDYQYFGGEAYNRVMATGRKVNLYQSPRDTAQHELAAYADLRQDIGKHVSLNAGLRMDHHSEVGTEWVPQGGVTVLLPHDAQVKAIVSKGFRNPTLRELYLFPPHNTQLRPERLMNYELAYTQRLMGGKLRYSANVFYLKATNLIQTLPVNGRPQNVNTGNVENWGAEAEATYRMDTQWAVNGNYSFLHMKKPLVGAPEHKLYAGVNHTCGKMSVHTGVQWVTGLYTLTSPKHQENFVLWNVTASYALCPQLTLYARGENLLAQHYEINAGFPMPRATVMGGLRLQF